MVSKRILVFLLLNLVTILSQPLPSYHHHPLHYSLHTDKVSLLAFKRTVPLTSTLFNWDETNQVCNFTGVTCDKERHRVVRLNLNASNLSGTMPPYLSNLTQLRILKLADNHFSGIIPLDFSFLRHLRNLKLDNNMFSGPIPHSLAFLPNLTLISLKGNKLNGTIPPSFFSNCSLLYYVELSDNLIRGTIPAEIGKCPNLWNLNLYGNQLTGRIPFSLTNCTNIMNVDVENNHLNGELPSDIVPKLQEIWYLHLSYNNMVSHDGNTNLTPFFHALANCTQLLELELSGMKLGGYLSSSVGRLSATLQHLVLQENQLVGSIPPEIGNLSSLTLLNLTSNLFAGTIPPQISQLPRLEQLSLSHNFLTGSIPAAIGQLTSLGLLDLSNNNFTGNVPETLGDLIRLNDLFLNNNLLSGQVPGSLGRCTDLYKVDLSYNRFTGRIPPEISEMHEIRIFLNLSHNQLNGSLPIELSKLENVQEIDLSSNHLGGSIFVQISNCIALRLINLSSNSLQGKLPETLDDLKNLEVFDVSVNQLSGMIPASLSKNPILSFLNLSFNNFDGMIPTGGIFDSLTKQSFLGEQNLCGHILGFPACPKKKHYLRPRVYLIALSIIIPVYALLTVICCVTGCRRWKCMSFSRQTEDEDEVPPELKHNFPRITHKELSEATRGFDDQQLIGTGSYGHVYKGVLPDGTLIAVKVLHFQTRNSTKSFNRECQILRRIRHRNLIRIITACSLPNFKALVLPYMANGSLDSRLYPQSGSSGLSLIQRVSICRDIAEGMAYLHHHSPVKVIHCDLKPSNVLLNDDMTALVSDFGIARLVSSVIKNVGNSTANLLHGSVGYIAPEYGFGSSTSTKGDVYSFGAMVLEIVTRKRPTDEMFTGGLDLHKYVKVHYHRQMEIVDSSLLRALKDQSPEVRKMWEVALAELIELGIVCTQDSPTTRPTMLDAADDLDRLKRYLDGDTTATFTSSLGVSSSTFSSDAFL